MAIKLMPLPILKFCSQPFRVEDAKGSAEIPQGPTGVQLTQNVERVIEPRQHNIGRSVFVASHLAEMYGHPLRGKACPGMEILFQCLTVADHSPLSIFERPCGRGF